jgi:hypothetical protein
MRNMCGEVFTSHTIIGGPGKQVLKAKFTRPFLLGFIYFTPVSPLVFHSFFVFEASFSCL